MKTHRVAASALLLKPKADAFLQAYTTQKPSAPRGAFVDAKGRAVAVYDLIRIDADTSVLVVASSVRGRLEAHLKPFLFLTDTTLSGLPHGVFWDLDSEEGAAPGAVTEIRGGWTIRRSAGALRVVSEPIADTVDETAFRLWRTRNRLPLQGEDYNDPMLLNLADPDLVCFDKGCYLGQEIMARVHYKGRAPLKLASVLESECPAELRAQLTSRIWDPAAGDYRGFVFLPA